MITKLTQEGINNAIINIEYKKMGKKTMICCLTLQNGFEVIGKAHCQNDNEFDESIGQDIALEDAKNKVWELEGYIMQNFIYNYECDKSCVGKTDV